jgi:hypothetical protein
MTPKKSYNEALAASGRFPAPEYTDKSSTGNSVPVTTSPGGDSWYRQGGVQPVDFILSNNLPHWKGTVIQYVFRAGLKAKPDAIGASSLANEMEDVKKAIWWLEKHLEHLQKVEL